MTKGKFSHFLKILCHQTDLGESTKHSVFQFTVGYKFDL